MYIDESSTAKHGGLAKSNFDYASVGAECKDVFAWPSEIFNSNINKNETATVAGVKFYVA